MNKKSSSSSTRLTLPSCHDKDKDNRDITKKNNDNFAPLSQGVSETEEEEEAFENGNANNNSKDDDDDNDNDNKSDDYGNKNGDDIETAFFDESEYSSDHDEDAVEVMIEGNPHLDHLQQEQHRQRRKLYNKRQLGKMSSLNGKAHHKKNRRRRRRSSSSSATTLLERHSEHEWLRQAVNSNPENRSDRNNESKDDDEGGDQHKSQPPSSDVVVVVWWKRGEYWCVGIFVTLLAAGLTWLCVSGRVPQFDLSSSSSSNENIKDNEEAATNQQQPGSSSLTPTTTTTDIFGP